METYNSENRPYYAVSRQGDYLFEVFETATDNLVGKLVRNRDSGIAPDGTMTAHGVDGRQLLIDGKPYYTGWENYRVADMVDWASPQPVQKDPAPTLPVPKAASPRRTPSAPRVEPARPVPTVEDAPARAHTHRLDAWTGLGQTIPEGTTPEEALDLAGLAGWNVRRVPLTAQAAPGVTVEVPGNFAVLRDTDGDPAVVSVVGPDYQVIQNEDLLPLAYALIEETGAQVVTAGRLPRGNRESSFLTLRMPRPLKVGQDAVELYMTLQNTHDGRAASAVVLTPVHVQSRAVLNLDLPGVPHKLRLTHYAGAQEMLQKQVQDAMDHVYAYTDAFEEIAGEMATRRLSQAGFQKLTYRAFAAPASAPSATQTRAENKLMRMERLYSARGQENGWAALIAIAEWHDFYSPVRPVGGSEIAARQRKALLEPDVKVKALALLSAD